MIRATAAMTGSEHSESVPDEVLVTAALQRPDDFRMLYERYMERIYRYLIARVRRPEEAADLTQTVFMRAFDSLPRYKPARAPFSGWLFRIARNAATDLLRRRRDTVPFDGLEDVLGAPLSDGPEVSAEKKERLERLRGHVARLDSRKQELLALRFAAGLTVREIAPTIGKSEAAVRKQLERTIDMLKEMYDDQLP